MKLFHKLFITYVLVAVLALLISGAFAGYLVFEAAGRTQFRVLSAYGREMAAFLEDREWSPEDLRRVQKRADALSQEGYALIWLVDRDGLVRLASSSAAPPRGNRLSPHDMQEVLNGRTTISRLRPNIAGAPSDQIGEGPVVAIPVLRNETVAGAVLLTPALEALVKARQDILRFILIGSGVAALVVAVISYYISQRIARPVELVSRGARRIAQGDFSYRVSWQSKDEVGRLTESFNEMAGELDRLETARRDLMANVSHELKGPLARVAGYLEAVHDGIGGEQAREKHLGIVRREVGRLTRLVNDLLDFSRLEAGRLKLLAIPCDLAPHLTRAAEVFATPAAAAGVTLAVEVPSQLGIVKTEPERIEQVVANLLENAIAFTPRGGLVTLSAAEEQSALTVLVTDTGPGLPATELDRVWERFYKADRARTPGHQGFGLGLTIVKQLVELQGGEVFAESEPGKGSRFGFRLPLAQPDQADAEI